MAYPILFLVGYWLITGQDARLGGAVVIEGTGFWAFWPERAVTSGAFVILLLG